MAERYYYRFGVGTELGRLFRRWWNEFVKAERARNVYLQKLGAEGWQDNEQMLAGGVLAVSFPKDRNVDERIWRKSHKDSDGVQMYVPNVERRTGYIILPRRGFRPSDTAHRVYDKRVYSWAQAANQYTMKEWAAQAGVTLTGDKTKDAERVNDAMRDACLAHYMDFFVKEYDPDVLDKRERVPWWAREAVRIEVARVKLPVITPMSLYRMLEADNPTGETAAAGPKGGVVTVNEQAPNFFEYGGRYYVAVSRKCNRKELEDVAQASFNMKLAVMRQAAGMEAGSTD